MNLIAALIIAFIVTKLADRITNPFVEWAFTGEKTKALVPVVEATLNVIMGVLFALALHANVLLGVEGVEVTPLGAYIVTGIVAGLGTDVVTSIGELGKGTVQVVQRQANKPTPV